MEVGKVVGEGKTGVLFDWRLIHLRDTRYGTVRSTQYAGSWPDRMEKMRKCEIVSDMYVQYHELSRR